MFSPVLFLAYVRTLATCTSLTKKTTNNNKKSHTWLRKRRRLEPNMPPSNTVRISVGRRRVQVEQHRGWANYNQNRTFGVGVAQTQKKQIMPANILESRSRQRKTLDSTHALPPLPRNTEASISTCGSFRLSRLVQQGCAR